MTKIDFQVPAERGNFISRLHIGNVITFFALGNAIPSCTAIWGLLEVPKVGRHDVLNE